MATKTANGAETPRLATSRCDSALLDIHTVAVKRLIAARQGTRLRHLRRAERRPAVGPVSSEQIEDTMAMLSEMGIQVVESEEARRGEAASAKRRQGRGEDEEAEEEETPGGNVDEESLGRTDDPVRMYLREMGSVELLSREGEIAIAKRIEAGRDMMIGGLCESPLTFRAIIAWHDALKAGDAAARHRSTWRPPGRPADDARGRPPPEAEARSRRARKARARRPVALRAGGEAEAGGPRHLRGDRGALQEAAQDVSQAPGRHTAGEESPAGPRRPTRSSAQELVGLVEKVRLHNNRIEELVDQLKRLNQRLTGLEGQLLRMAEALQGQARRLPAATIAATSWTRTGSSASASCRARRGRPSSPSTRTTSSGARPRSAMSPPTPACRSASSAASIRPSAAASAT